VGRQGKHTQALAVAREGLRLLEQTGRGQEEAEFRRLEGVALLGLRQVDEGQRALKQALAVARRQGTKIYELRIATSLARLWLDQGRREKARVLLGTTYGWFEEGFGSPDLKNAKALLDEIGSL